MNDQYPRVRGRCRALCCFDVARAVDLARASRTLAASPRAPFRHKAAFPAQGGVQPPLRVDWPAGVPADVSLPGGVVLDGTVEVAVYDFGAVAVTWRAALDGPLDGLVELTGALYENAALIEASRGVARQLLAALGDAAERPNLHALVEDYFVLQLEPVTDEVDAFLARHRAALARVLRAEPRALSEQEVASALENPVSYGRADAALVDWLGAVLVGRDSGDEQLLLELATVELLELRVLDRQLDSEIEAAYTLLARPRAWPSAWSTRRAELTRLARAQADDALLHEGIDNALKLFGDDYLARLYGASADRFHFDSYDAAIQRKLTVLERIYERLADQAARARSEVLEWIIIVLIAADLLLYFTPLR